MLVPLALLLAGGVQTRTENVLLGCAIGIFAVDGLFAVSSDSGVAHAFAPLLIAGSLAIAVLLYCPHLATLVWVALAVNVVLTVPPLSATVHTWMGTFGALLVLCLLGRNSDGTPGMPLPA
jgi:hypothetical protein